MPDGGERHLDMIDLISIDEASGHVRLHLIEHGDWIDCDAKLERIRQRLNRYIHFGPVPRLQLRPSGLTGVLPGVRARCPGRGNVKRKRIAFCAAASLLLCPIHSAWAA